MRLARSTALLAVGFAFQAVTASAEPISAPVDMSLTVDKPIQQIIAHYSLDEQRATLSRRAAAGFVFVGMCHGAGFPDAMGAIQLIMAADPDVPYQAAAIAMLGIYSRAAFGRQVSSVCAKAYDDAMAKK